MSTNLSKISIAVLLFTSTSSFALASEAKQLSLLEENTSFRTKFTSQPNIEKGEFTVQAQASMIYIIEQSLPDFISQVASHNKIKLTMSDQVSGILQKISFPTKPELILSELQKSHGVQWHLENDHLFVSNSLENTNRLVKLGSINFIKLKTLLKDAGLKSGANKLSFREDENAVLMIGSEKYIVMVENIIKTHQSKTKKKKQS